MTCPIWNMQHLSTTPWQESMQCIHWNVQGTWNHVLEPNRPVSYTLATRQQINYRDGQNWQHCHPCWTHEKLQGCRDDKGIWRSSTNWNKQALSLRNTYSTMRFLKTWITTSATRISSTWNWCHRGAIDRMQRRWPYATSKPISSAYSQGYPMTFH